MSVIREPLARYLQFAHANEKRLSCARPVRDVAVLHSFPSLALDWKILLRTIPHVLMGHGAN